VHKNWTYLLMLLLTAVMLTALLRSPGQATPPAAERFKQQVISTAPRSLSGLRLINSADGSTVTNLQFQQQWTLVFSGYSRCPDICPTTLAMLSQLRQRLQQQVQVAFVSVDISYDRGVRLQNYLNHFAADITGLTGSATQVSAALELLGLRGTVVVSSGATPAAVADIGHSGAVALIGPDGNLWGLFRHPLQVEPMYDLLTELTAAG